MKKILRTTITLTAILLAVKVIKENIKIEFEFID